jgi:hypothetical protein
MNRILLPLLLAIAPALPSQAGRTLAVTPLLDFGGAQDDPASELLRVTGVIRTDDGRFVVASARPLEVRVYDRRGQLERRLGRAGNGPGEFRYGASVHHWPGDSVLAYSDGTRRWMLFALDGRLVREWPAAAAEPSPHAITLVGGGFFSERLSGDRLQCRAAMIRTQAPPAGPTHEGVVDAAGRTWLRRVDGDAWRVLDASGRSLGTITLPGFAPTQVLGDTLIGHRTDEDGFAHIVMQRVQLPRAAPMSTKCPPAVRQSERSGELKATIRNAMTAAEAYYSNHRRYPRNLGEVRGMLEIPDGFEGSFESTADGNGFAFSAWETSTGYRCLVSVGYSIRSYYDGIIGCGG